MPVEDPQRPSPPFAGVTAAGVDHVRLQYEYLAARDIDGYLSLLDRDMSVDGPPGSRTCGREAVGALRGRQLAGGSMSCTVSQVVASGSTVAAIGRYRGDALHGRWVEAEFCEVFTLAPSGLLLSQKTFYRGDPPT
ncbi:nuclear transport factor 2 family protein [Streptomyces sp. NPDC006658]|uniref:nuclear transport factor 2 family protein n=1 Tax=Streptomyces sp. NPDC006658 TaxID=3156900 RepID=UPI0033F9EAAE